MAAHRYWRARTFTTYEGGRVFALSEFQLLAGATRVDGSAVLTADASPVSGTLASLKDASTATTCVLPISAVLQWDFGGSPQNVTDVRLGSTASQLPFLLSFFIDWSDNGADWSVLYEDGFPGVAWPGPSSMTVTAPRLMAGETMVDRDWSDGVTSDGTTYSTGSPTYGMSGGGDTLALGVSGTDVKVRFTPHVSFADVDLTCELVPAGGEAGIVLRTAGWSNANDSYAYGVFMNATAVAIARGDNGGSGSYTPMVSAAHGANVGNLNTMRVRWVGNQYSVWVNGTLRLTGTDSTYLGAGEVGLRVYNSTAYFKSLVARKVYTQDSLALNPIGGPVAPPDSPFLPLGAYAPSVAAFDVTRPLAARPNFLYSAEARGRISGTVKRKADPTNVPVRRRVRLIRDRDGLLVAETWSDAVTGAYEFLWVEEWEAYTVIAYDFEHDFRAVVADNLQPEVMV